MNLNLITANTYEYNSDLYDYDISAMNTNSSYGYESRNLEMTSLGSQKGHRGNESIVEEANRLECACVIASHVPQTENGGQ